MEEFLKRNCQIDLEINRHRIIFNHRNNLTSLIIVPGFPRLYQILPNVRAIYRILSLTSLSTPVLVRYQTFFSPCLLLALQTNPTPSILATCTSFPPPPAPPAKNIFPLLHFYHNPSYNHHLITAAFPRPCKCHSTSALFVRGYKEYFLYRLGVRM